SGPKRPKQPQKRLRGHGTTFSTVPHNLRSGSGVAATPGDQQRTSSRQEQQHTCRRQHVRQPCRTGARQRASHPPDTRTAASTLPPPAQRNSTPAGANTFVSHSAPVPGSAPATPPALVPGPAACSATTLTLTQPIRSPSAS